MPRTRVGRKPASVNASRAARWCSASVSMVVSTPSGFIPASNHRPATPAPVPISTTADARTVAASMASSAPVPGEGALVPSWSARSVALSRISSGGTKPSACAQLADLSLMVSSDPWLRCQSTYAPGTVEGLLHRITTNLFLDQVRRRRRIRIEPWGDATEQLAGPDGTSTPERGFEHANLDQDVQKALDALPPEFRAAVVLCDMEGLSYEEIAVTLGIKLGTVRSRIHRGRAQLREALAHRAPTAPNEAEPRPMTLAVPSPRTRAALEPALRSS